MGRRRRLKSDGEAVGAADVSVVASFDVAGGEVAGVDGGVDVGGSVMVWSLSYFCTSSCYPE